MAQTLIAKGQATIIIQKDGYTITQSLGEYIFPQIRAGRYSLQYLFTNGHTAETLQTLQGV